MSLRTIKDTNLGRLVKRGARNEYQMGSRFLWVIFELDIDPVRQMLSFRENGGERDRCWQLCGAFFKTKWTKRRFFVTWLRYFHQDFFELRTQTTDWPLL
jgi:hypothetical protein